MPDKSQWAEIRARPGDNLAASRATLEGAGTVTRWTRKLREEEQSQQETPQQETPQQETPQQEAQEVLQQTVLLSADLTQAMSTDNAEIMSGNFVLVVRLDCDLDLIKSPQLLRLFHGLAAGQSELGSTHSGKLGLPLKLGLPFAGRYPLMVDFRSINMVDGSGLSCLLRGHKALLAVGLRLAVLLLPGSQPARVFGMAKMEMIIPVFGSLDEL